MHRVPVTAANSTIISVGYGGFARTLEVEVRSGAVYQYFEVPMVVYHDLLSAGAPGVYFDAVVKKGGYRYERVH